MTGAVGSGRPLRFFLLVIAAWIGGRVTMQLLGGALVTPTDPLHQAPDRVAKAPAPPSFPPLASSPRVAPLPRHAAPIRQPGTASNGGALDLMDFIRFTTAFSGRHYGASSALAALADTETARAPWPVAIPAAPPPPGNDRWRASAWMLWRPEGAATSASLSGGQLGASQAGARFDYDLTPHAPSRLAAYARVSAALAHPTQPEAALGVAIQPSRHLPVSIGVERRIALDRTARNAMAVVIAGGFGPREALPGLMAEGYAQTGMVGARSRDAFVDGRLSITHPVDRTAMALGASLSGGAQPGVHRVDVGPALHVRLPTAPVAARMMMEWRERVSGQARPRSGLALTLAADF